MFHSSTVTSAFRFLFRKNWNWRLNSILLQPRYYCLRGSTSRNRNCFLHQHRHIWNQFYLPSTKILLLEGVNIGNIDYIVTWFCCSIEWQHRNSLPRWMSFLSLDSLNESPFFGMVLHNKFLMEKLGKEYILRCNHFRLCHNKTTFIYPHSW